jgi:hypothetical protein
LSAKTEEERAQYITAVKKVKETATLKLSSHIKGIIKMKRGNERKRKEKKKKEKRKR